MKPMLFWKISAGFWLIFVLIVESNWLSFNFVHPLPSETTRALSKITLAAAQAALHRGGLAELHGQMAIWPQDDRGKLLVQPWTKDSKAEGNIDSGAVSVRALSSDGTPYQLTYKVTRHLGYGRGPFDIPHEIVMLSLLGGLLFS